LAAFDIGIKALIMIKWNQIRLFNLITKCNRLPRGGGKRNGSSTTALGGSLGRSGASA
jgi:hypothetical protein